MAHDPKKAIVTGASQEIGLGLAKALLEHGYRVIATSHNIPKAHSLSESPNLLLVDGDIGQPTTTAKTVDSAVARGIQLRMEVTWK